VLRGNRHVIPAQAGIQGRTAAIWSLGACQASRLGSRLRGNDVPVGQASVENQWNENSKTDDRASDSSKNQVAALASARWTAVHVIGWRRDMMVLPSW
jgi:hypothetical protein